MSNVVICEGKDIVKRTQKALEVLSPSLPKPSSKILIKPNLVEAMDKESGAITRPEIVEGIIKFLDDSKYEIVIGESSAGWDTESCFRKAGYDYLPEKYKVEIVNFDEGEFTKIKLNGIVWKDVEVTEWALKSNYIISAAVLKQHKTLVTLTLKNMMGILRPKGDYPNKEYIHKEYDWKMWSHRLCDLLKRIKPDLGVIDGTTAMFDHHIRGRTERKEITIVGEDPLSVDYVCADILGKKGVFYLKEALERNIGKKAKSIKRLRLF